MLQEWLIEEKGFRILLVTLEQFESYPDGKVLYDIFGDKSIKGIDAFDNDTRAGYMAYGVRVRN